MPTIATAIPDTNAARQPQLDSCSGVSSRVKNPPTAEPSIVPNVAPNIEKLEKKPRLRAGEFSARNTIELVNSPPTAMPWNILSSTIRNDAATPSVA